MCGIAGIVDAALPEVELSVRLGLMYDTLVHRGPDEAGAALMRIEGRAWHAGD